MEAVFTAEYFVQRDTSQMNSIFFLHLPALRPEISSQLPRRELTWRDKRRKKQREIISSKPFVFHSEEERPVINNGRLHSQQHCS